MPYDEEEPPFWEPSVELNPLTEKIIGAAMEVHRHLGPGLDESIYEAAMCIELELRGVSFQRQVEFDVTYNGGQNWEETSRFDRGRKGVSRIESNRADRCGA